MSLGRIAIHRKGRVSRGDGRMQVQVTHDRETPDKHLEREPGPEGRSWEIKSRDAAIRSGPDLFYSLLVSTYVPGCSLLAGAGRPVVQTAGISTHKTYSMAAAAVLSKHGVGATGLTSRPTPFVFMSRQQISNARRERPQARFTSGVYSSVKEYSRHKMASGRYVHCRRADCSLGVLSVEPD